MASPHIGCGFVFLFFCQIAAAGESRDLLDQVREHPINGGIQIGYVLTEFYEPNGDAQGRIDDNVRALEAHLSDPDVSSKEEMLKKYRNSLQEKHARTSEGIFVQGKGFFANRLQTKNLKSLWHIRQTPYAYTITNDQILVVRHDPEAHTLDYKDIAMRSIGRLGKLDPDILIRLSQGDTQTVRNGDNIILKNGNLNVSLVIASGATRVHSIEQTVPQEKQKQLIVFENYKTLGGISVPTTVTDYLETKWSKSTRIFEVKEITWGDSYSVPLINQDFGMLYVCDIRFKPGITYKALSRLATDSQIAEWISNPDALEKHNSAMPDL